MKRPLLLSVLIPVVGDQEGLKQCLTSLENQKLSVSEFEVLLVGDALSGFAFKNSKLTIRCLEIERPCSLSRAYNVGVQAASGDRVFFLDHRVKVDSACLLMQVKTHMAMPEMEFGILGNIEIHASCQNYIWGFLLANSDLILNKFSLENGKLYDFNVFSGLNFSLPRRSILASGLFDEVIDSSKTDLAMQELGMRMNAVPVVAAYVDGCKTVLQRLPAIEDFFRISSDRGAGLAVVHLKHPALRGKVDDYDRVDRFFWKSPPARLQQKIAGLTEKVVKLSEVEFSGVGAVSLPMLRKGSDPLWQKLQLLGKMRTRDVLMFAERAEEGVDFALKEIKEAGKTGCSAVSKFYLAVLFLQRYHEVLGYFAAEASIALCGIDKQDAPNSEKKQILEFVPEKSKGRILLSCNYFWPMVGGTELFVEDLGLKLLSEGYEVDVVCRHSDLRTSFNLKGLNIIPLNCWLCFKDDMGPDVEVYRRMVTDERYKAVIVLGHPDGWVCCQLRNLPHKKRPRLIVMPSMNADNLNSWTKHGNMGVIRDVLNSADELVTVSENGVDASVINELGLRHTFLPHAVSDEYSDKSIRMRLGLSDSSPLLCCVGNFWPVKNQSGLLDVMSRDENDWNLVLAGAPGPWPHLREYYLDCWQLASNDPRIHFTGSLKALEAAALIHEADALLLPSLGESAGPLVVLQAMALGTPWIATPECNSVKDEAGGLIVPLEDFPDAVQALQESSDKVSELITLGREHWQRCFTWEKSLHGFIDLIEGREPSVDLKMPEDIRIRWQEIAAQVFSF